MDPDKTHRVSRETGVITVRAKRIFVWMPVILFCGGAFLFWIRHTIRAEFEAYSKGKGVHAKRYENDMKVLEKRLAELEEMKKEWDKTDVDRRLNTIERSAPR